MPLAPMGIWKVLIFLAFEPVYMDKLKLHWVWLSVISYTIMCFGVSSSPVLRFQFCHLNETEIDFSKVFNSLRSEFIHENGLLVSPILPFHEETHTHPSCLIKMQVYRLKKVTMHSMPRKWKNVKNLISRELKLLWMTMIPRWKAFGVTI